MRGDNQMGRKRKRRVAQLTPKQEIQAMDNHRLSEEEVKHLREKIKNLLGDK